MDALVEHIDAEQQLQPVACVRLEVRKRLVGIRVIRVSLIHHNVRVDPGEPLRHMGYHLVHVLLVGAEHDVFSTCLRDMMLKDKIKSVCLCQCPAQRVQIFLVCVLNVQCSQVIHPRLILRKRFLVLINSGHIFRGRQNAPDDCFAKGHIDCNMSIKEFFGYIAVIVQIPDVCCRQTHKFCVLAQL